MKMGLTGSPKKFAAQVQSVGKLQEEIESGLAWQETHACKSDEEQRLVVLGVPVGTPSFVAKWLNNKLEEHGQDNPLVKVAMCLCKCCFWCLEKFVKFVNRNAYIVTAIHGTNFCSSAKKACGLIFNNIARVAVLDKVTDFLLFLGKLVVVGGVTLLSFYIFSGQLDDNPVYKFKTPQFNYWYLPVVLTMVGTYFIATSFFSVYTMAVDTVFLCFLLVFPD